MSARKGIGHKERGKTSDDNGVEMCRKENSLFGESVEHVKNKKEWVDEDILHRK